ncbi:MAG: glycosyltransferase [Anaerolineales bacterium]|nr:glycosyltransferase [Anaerolineales bacterium]
MKILFVVPYVPNLIRVRPYNLIRFLAGEGHEVTVATLVSNELECQDVENLAQYCHQVHAFPLPKWRSLSNSLLAVPTSQPLQSVYCWTPELADFMLNEISTRSNGNGYDIVHIEHLRGARYGLFLKKKLAGRGKQPPIVWDSVDSITHLFRQSSSHSKSFFGRWVTTFELSRTERFERAMLDAFERVLVTSTIDKDALLSLAPENGANGVVKVLPNGVDLDYFHPNEEVEREPATLIVSGKMSYHANVTMVLHLVQNIMPAIWEQKPDVKLLIVGKDPVSEIQALAENPAIEVTGTVPDIRPYLRSATLALTPVVYGAGIQNKVLEAMATGTPVVSTPLAVSALDVVSGQDIEVAQNPLEFARKVVYLLQHPEIRQRIGDAGLAYVQNNHKWSVIAERLEGIYHEVSENHN